MLGQLECLLILVGSIDLNGRKSQWSVMLYTGILTPATVYKSGKHKLHFKSDDINDDFACLCTERKQ